MDKVLVQVDGPLATLTINNPQKRNALDPEILTEIGLFVDELNRNETLRTIILRGEGNRAFCAGYSIDKIEVNGDGQNLLEKTFSSLRDSRLSIIGMLNGIVVGAGLDLALNCDIRIAADDIKLGITPAKLGIVYHHDGIRRLAQVVGIPAAKELLFTGNLITAERAQAMGLVNQVVKRDELERTVFELARQLSENAPLTIAGSKRILNALVDATPLTNEQETEFARLRAQAFLSEDFAEGQKAFLEKRRPVFKGK